MSLIEVRVEVEPASAGAAEEALFEETSGAWSVIENIVVRRAWLVGIFESASEANRSWAHVSALPAIRPVSPPELRELGEAEWRESYKAHFHPWRFGPLHWVPVWERGHYAVPAGERVLWLDPGLAFGTGNHETTRLCCERLVALAPGPGAPSGVIDAGCGSGILALSAARLGFAPVYGFDLDPDAVRVSRENAELNGLDQAVEFAVAGLPDGLRGRQGAVVVANIQADILTRHASALASAVGPGGTLILSGILESEREAVAATFTSACPAWRLDSRRLGEWCDLALTADQR